MTGRVIDGDHLMLYRTVVRAAQGYRQGVLLDLPRLGDWLREQGLGDDGLARYAQRHVRSAARRGWVRSRADRRDRALPSIQHRFAEPFDDLSARLALRPLPGVGSVTYVYALAALLLVTGVLGLAALYRMVSVVVGFAERRSNFVAAVSHELKTPLTAIRMYGEMLRDGMVPSEAKRDEYYRHITVEVGAAQPPDQQRARVLAAREGHARHGAGDRLGGAGACARWPSWCARTSRGRGSSSAWTSTRSCRRCASSATRCCRCCGISSTTP